MTGLAIAGRLLQSLEAVLYGLATKPKWSFVCMNRQLLMVVLRQVFVGSGLESNFPCVVGCAWKVFSVLA